MIKIDFNRLRSETKPKITSAVSNLNQASNLLKGLKIPSNFCYLFDLKSMSSQIEQIVTDVKGINTYIDQKTAEFDAVRNARVPIGLGAGANVLNYEYNLTTAKKIGASTANTFISIVKGIADFGESLIDTAAVVTSVPLTVLTVGQDIAQSLKAGKGLLDIDFKNTKDLWAGTMSMVAEDTVGNAFSKFYEKTKVGRWLDTNAYTPFKSGGAVTKVAEGIGQIAGVVALTVLTCGAGTGAAGATTAAKAAATKTAVSSAIAGARGFGEGAEYFWSKQRDSSWSGLERKKERGEISQETLENYKALNKISEDDLFNLYRFHQITQEDYDNMKQLKKQLDAMPEDWINVKNALGGLGYATAIGGWEALQFYVGNKINGINLNGLSNFQNAAIRVGADTLFNTADTPFRAGVESLLTKRNFKDIFDEQGGISSVLVSAGVGAIGSSIGEYVTYKANKYNNIEDTMTNPNRINTDDNESILSRLKKNLRMKKYESILKKSNGLDEVMKQAVKNGDAEEVYDMLKGEMLFQAYMNGYTNGNIREEIKKFRQISMQNIISNLEIKDDTVKELINGAISKNIIETSDAVNVIKRYAENSPLEEMEKLINMLDIDDDVEIGLHGTGGQTIGPTIMKEGINLGDLSTINNGDYVMISKNVKVIDKNFAIDTLFSGSEGGAWYKNGDGNVCDVVVVSKPKSISDIEMQYTTPNGVARVKPEYISGFIRIDPINKVLKVYLNNR